MFVHSIAHWVFIIYEYFNNLISFTAVGNQLIEELLHESEIEDFVPSDEDVGDSEFQPLPAAASSESSEDESDTPVGYERGHGKGRGKGRGRNCG